MEKISSPLPGRVAYVFEVKTMAAVAGGGTVWFEFSNGLSYWLLQDGSATARSAAAARAAAPERLRRTRHRGEGIVVWSLFPVRRAVKHML